MLKSLPVNIDKLLNELKQDQNVLGIYLFGSFATGNFKPYSDVDICLVLKDNSRKVTINYLGFSGKHVDISVFSMLPLSAQYKVFKEGVPLFERDKDLLLDLKVRTLREYLDNKHIFDLQWNYMLRKEAVAL